MKARRIVLLFALALTLVITAVEFAGVTYPYVLPTVTMKVFDHVEMKELTAAAATYEHWIAESPESIQSGSLLFGNVTLCCSQDPSAFLPVLFILTTNQMSSWKDRSTGPREWIAETSVANYTFSGPEETETLTFRLTVGLSDVYHFVGFCPVYEKPTLNLNVSTIEESLIVKLVPVCASLVSVLLIIADLWSGSTPQEASKTGRR